MMYIYTIYIDINIDNLYIYILINQEVRNERMVIAAGSFHPVSADVVVEISSLKRDIGTGMGPPSDVCWFIHHYKAH